MLITGLEGPITIASARLSASTTSGVGLRLGDPLELDPEHLGLAAVDDQVLLQAALAGRGPHPGADRRVAHRQHPGGDPERAGDLRLGVGRAAAGVEELAAVEAGGEVAVGEAEPVRRAEPGEALEDGEGVVADPPAALGVDFAAQPVGDEVGVGGDVDAERLDVVGRCWRSPSGRRRSPPACRRRVWRRRCRRRAALPASAAGAPAQAHDQWSPSGRPVSLIPAWAL